MSLTLDGGTGNITGLNVEAGNLPAGNILQVVKYQRPGGPTATSSLVGASDTAGWINMMTKDITTKVDNSKILVVVQYVSFGQTRGRMRVTRGGSEITGDRYAHYTTSSSVMVNYSLTFEDSPSASAGTTLTYNVDVESFTGTLYFGYGDSNGGSNAILALMEIAP